MTPAFASTAGAFFKRAPFRRPLDLTLWLIVAAHLVALLSFLLILGSLSPAKADTPACSGTNLLEELKAENPATYAQVIAEGDKVPNGKNIFWKIEKPGLATSYLLGTMHVTDPRVLKMPAGAQEAQSRAKTIVVESDEVLDEKKSMAVLLMKPELTMFTDGRSLDSLVPKDDLQVLQEGLKSRGITYSAVSRMKPWMLMGVVALPACELARKGEKNVFLDKKIALQATAEGKQIKGLETLEEQVGAINSLPMDLQVKSIVEAVRLGKKMDDLFFTMTDLYLAQQIGVLTPLMKAVAPDGTDDESGYGDFDKLIITKRNHLMAERAAPILAEGPTFIAVGAAHLPGEEGLVELLRKQGFTVTAVN